MYFGVPDLSLVPALPSGNFGAQGPGAPNTQTAIGQGDPNGAFRLFSGPSNTASEIKNVPRDSNARC